MTVCFLFSSHVGNQALKSKVPVMVWTVPKGSWVWMFGSQVVDLFRKNWGMPCWKMCITRGGLWEFKIPWHFQLALFQCLIVEPTSYLSCQLQLQHHACLSACLPAAMSHEMMTMDSNPLELWAPIKYFLLYVVLVMVFCHSNRNPKIRDPP